MHLGLVAIGNQKSFALLFEHYSKFIYSFALKLTRSESLAKEILQEVFMKIWINRETLAKIDNFGAYLNRVTRNHYYNILKKQAQEALLSFELAKQLSEVVNETENSIIYRDMEQFLGKAVSHLSPQQKLIYTLCREEGLKYNEVAKRLNISSFTVQTHMKLALKSIRTYFIQINTLFFFFLILLILFID